MPKLVVDPGLHKHNFISHIKDPFCKHQTKLQLTITIIFHTIIFPLGLFRLGQIIYRHFCKRSAIPAAKQPDQLPLKKQAVQSVQNSIPQTKVTVQNTLPAEPTVVKDDPAPVRRAKEFAETILNVHAHEEFTPSEFDTGGPNNEKIEHLRHLYHTKYNPAFKQAIKDHPDNPWDTGKVHKAAHELMMVSYAIAHYALEDAHSFTKTLTGSKKTQNRLRKNFLNNRVLLCARVYHIIKKRPAWSPELQKTVEPGYVSEKQKQLFHTPEHIQNSWNIMYNDICTRTNSLLDTGNRIFVDFPNNQMKYLAGDR